MAKDGTNRGGARPGAGRKPKALKEKLDAGNPGNHPLRRLDIPENIEGVDMPKPGDYLSAMQRDGKPLGADEIYTKMCRWLGKLGCDKFAARWMQCEEAITRYGLVGKHPTVTTSVVQSPFVSMSHSYLKQAQQMWLQIYQVVKENCTVDIDSGDEIDPMERLLRANGIKRKMIQRSVISLLRCGQRRKKYLTPVRD